MPTYATDLAQSQYTNDLDMSSDRVKLKILGISYSPLQKTSFHMLLAEENGPYRIPIAIGPSEAQAIAIKLENIITPRPMTHDLFCTMAKAFGIQIREVFIYKFEEGFFLSEMKCYNGETEVLVDARTSDAVAIALRMDAPIYTTREVIDQAGMKFDDDDMGVINTADDDANAIPKPDTQFSRIEDLEQKLQKCIEDENYEEASRLSEIINKLKGDKAPQ